MEDKTNIYTCNLNILAVLSFLYFSIFFKYKDIASSCRPDVDNACTNLILGI